MMNDCVEEDGAIEVPDNLMDFDDHAAGVVTRDAQGFDVRVEGLPLPGPINPHRVASVHVAALHSIGPFNGGVQAGEDGLNLPRVEISVGAGQQVPVARFSGIAHAHLSNDWMLFGMIR